MPARIEDYALIGDCQTAALVGRDGSIDWLCLPRFDSGACFAALLGDRNHGHWQIAPLASPRETRRRYRGDTLVLETEFETDEGGVAVVDFMPPRAEAADVVRIVEGRRGVVRMQTELVIRFDYGSRGWALQKALLEALESAWSEPDEGIWEVRGPRRHFTHSKVMAWVAFDRAVKAVERFGRDGPVERWRTLRARIHDEVRRLGFNPSIAAFTQSYGSDRLDASLLMIPLVGFLPANDPRMRGTVKAIERGLVEDGFVRRYAADPELNTARNIEENARAACARAEKPPPSDADTHATR